jgi:hypothetical protein
VLGFLANGDFETGELDPWTFGLSPGGSVQILDLFPVDLIAVPEPGTLLLLVGVLALVRRRSK